MWILKEVANKVCQLEGLRAYWCKVAWVTTSEASLSTNEKEQVVLALLDCPVEGGTGKNQWSDLLKDIRVREEVALMRSPAHEESDAGQCSTASLKWSKGSRDEKRNHVEVESKIRR